LISNRFGVGADTTDFDSGGDPSGDIPPAAFMHIGDAGKGSGEK
jgi:hypothetical protein